MNLRIDFALKRISAKFVDVEWRRALTSVGVYAGALFVFSVVLWTQGQRNPAAIIIAIFNGAFGTSFGIVETLSRATPLILCALAAAIPGRVSLFNIGGEGQFHAGAIAATAVVLLHSSGSSLWLLPAMVLSGMAAGAIWAMIPALLRTTLGINEILVGLMLNYISIHIVEYLVHGRWKDPSALGWPYSKEYPANAVLPGFYGSKVHLGLLFGIMAVLICYVIMRKTIWGVSARVIHSSVRTAKYLGINVKGYMIVALLLGGSLAAMAGISEVSVIQRRLRPSISPGYGYIGFLISWLGGHRFGTILPLSLLIGGLYSGSDAIQLTGSLPSATADIFLAIMFFALLVDGCLRNRTASKYGIVA